MPLAARMRPKNPPKERRTVAVRRPDSPADGHGDYMSYMKLRPGEIIRTESCAEYLYLGRYRNRALAPLAGSRGRVLPEGYLYAEMLDDADRTMDAMLLPSLGMCNARLCKRPKAWESLAGKVDLSPWRGHLDNIQGLIRID